ncbi:MULTISPECIES: hypothetical protein [unclassified Streptomyces]|uniref:hypothetical protein n=1 Tax=unclassified Streptomyces TaxID=2593676 RepID=UPI0012FF0271|nr:MULTISPECIES: hypothetical protein [unclassified Streptomyces]
MSCRSRRVPTVLATLAAAVLGGFLMASPAAAAPAAPSAPQTVAQGGDDFVWPTPPKPQMPEIPCVLPPLPGVPQLPCVGDFPDDFVWPIAPGE